MASKHQQLVDSIVERLAEEFSAMRTAIQAVSDQVSAQQPEPKTKKATGKVTNSLLYCRQQWVASPEFRTRFGFDSPEEEEAAFSSIPEGLSGEPRLLAEGRAVWAALSVSRKAEVRAEFLSE